MEALSKATSTHGPQKWSGWFGGYGLKGTGGVFESLGFRPGSLFTLAAAVAELGGGILTAVGLLGPVGPALIILVMLVAMLTAPWWHGFFASNDGIELPLANRTSALALMFARPGAYSLDRVLGLPRRRSDPSIAWTMSFTAMALGFGTVALRRIAPVRRHA